MVAGRDFNDGWQDLFLAETGRRIFAAVKLGLRPAAEPAARVCKD
jgi:hypothetical protein